MIQKNTQKTALLFSDIKGFSNIKDTGLREKIVDFNKSLLDNLVTPENSFYHNTWGDAFFICSSDSYFLAEIALKIRDEVKNTNWKRLGFPSDLAIRIGLHLESIVVRTDKKGKVDVMGSGIDLTARIEPIVDANEIFCTEEFRNNLLSNNYDSKIDAISIGNKQLAKNYAERPLFRLDWRGPESKYLNNKIEDLYWHDKYVFLTENKIEFEAFRVMKVISSKLEKLPIFTQWSGRGHIKITSAFFDEIQQETDDKGNINFEYPIPANTKFGDVLVVQYKFEAEDTTGRNIPMLSLNVRRKTEYFQADVILKYKTEAPSATLEILDQLETHFPKEVRSVEFDKTTKTYNFAVAKPQLNTKYVLKWKK
jgi:hypothetical protein